MPSQGKEKMAELPWKSEGAAGSGGRPGGGHSQSNPGVTRGLTMGKLKEPARLLAPCSFSVLPFGQQMSPMSAIPLEAQRSRAQERVLSFPFSSTQQPRFHSHSPPLGRWETLSQHAAKGCLSRSGLSTPAHSEERMSPGPAPGGKP